MKLPSIQYLTEQAVKALKQHPLVILSSAMAVCFAVYLVEYENKLDNAFPFINLLLCGYLGVPMFLSIDCYSAANDRPQQFQMASWLVGALMLVGIYFYLPGSEETLNKSVPYIRYAILAVAAHLLVSFAPFLNKGTLNGFWQFNKLLFLRFLLAVLYSGFIYVGLILAMFALDELFKVEVEGRRYAQVFFFVAGVFNTWFFVSGIPDEYAPLDREDQYPKGLRMFILYVLIPLLGLYFLILYSYSFKIIALWSWPSGIITYMIIAVAVLGILAMLLAYPYSLREESNPITFLKKGYYWILIPMIVMLYFAIGIRVADYGVTINRYITIFLAVWLTGTSIYMIAGGRDIRVIPISLFVIILLCSFGPWGLFRVSERSQVNRLEAVLTASGILEGKIKNEPQLNRSDTSIMKLDNPEINEGILTDSLHNEVVSILDYLEEYHGLSAIESWFDQNTREIAKQYGFSEDYVAIQLMGLDHARKHLNQEVVYYPSFYSNLDDRQWIDVSDYQFVYQVDYTRNASNNQFDSIRLHDGTEIHVWLDQNEIGLRQSPDDSTLVMDLREVYDRLKSDQEGSNEFRSKVSMDKMTITVEKAWGRAMFLIEHIQADHEAIMVCRGRMLIGLRDYR